MMKYRYKSVENAVRRIRELEQQIKELEDIATRYQNETVVLAKLAATGPAYFNLLEAMAAQRIRDRILRDKCGLNPDGTFINKREVPA